LSDSRGRIDAAPKTVERRLFAGLSTKVGARFAEGNHRHATQSLQSVA